MKFLGLDVGNRRVGVAFGDSELRLATPVGVITRATLLLDAQLIRRFAQDYDTTQLIVGLPRNMDGTQRRAGGGGDHLCRANCRCS